MTLNNDVDTERTETFVDGLEDLDGGAVDSGNVAGLIEFQHFTSWPTQQMTATWGS